MKITQNLIEIVSAILLVAVLLFMYIDRDETDTGVAYDCRLAEISVDYPQAVKQQCRKLLEGKK
jgi:hypothetical protein